MEKIREIAKRKKKKFIVPSNQEKKKRWESELFQMSVACVCSAL